MKLNTLQFEPTTIEKKNKVLISKMKRRQTEILITYQAFPSAKTYYVHVFNNSTHYSLKNLTMLFSVCAYIFLELLSLQPRKQILWVLFRIFIHLFFCVAIITRKKFLNLIKTMWKAYQEWYKNIFRQSNFVDIKY